MVVSVFQSSDNLQQILHNHPSYTILCIPAVLGEWWYIQISEGKKKNI